MRIVWLFHASSAFAWTGILSDEITIHVSPKGKDLNDGSRNKPLASIKKAQEMARRLDPKQKVRILLSGGTYYLPETIRFEAADNRAALTIAAEREGNVVISGGNIIRPKWSRIKDGVFMADMPAGTAFDQLYINGIRQRMARFPNAIPGKNVFDTWILRHDFKKDSLNDPLQPERIARWKNPEGAYIHAMHTALWGDMHWIVKGKNSDGTLIEEGGWQNNRPSPKHPAYRMVENVFEELDAPGEWFLDQSANKLYCIPEIGTDLSNALIETVRLAHLFEFNGTIEHPVNNITLKGLVFRHTKRTFMENREPLLRSDWTTYRGGAVLFNGAENCSVLDTEFDQVGGNAVFVNNYNRNILIRGCYIHDAGANGVAFVGDPASVRSPLFRYGPQEFSTIDKTPGPRTRNYPQSCTVDDCLITKTGRVEKQTAPVQISMAHRITVRDCSIYDVPRAGINISEGTFGGHLIEGCDIFNTVLETGDHGSFNSWGRDRYWTPDIKQSVPEVTSNPGLPFLDMLDSNIIRYNRWRCDHGWDIDLDDGSSWYRIHHNLLLNGGLKMREGYNRVATNNIIINNGLHPHVWYPNSGDVFTNNIVFSAHRPAIMNAAIPKDGKWGQMVDYNYFMGQEGQKEKFAINDCDSHSIWMKADFMDPATGDFRLTDAGLARASGFQNFPMDRFGVKKPVLARIAKHPAFPTPWSANQTTEKKTRLSAAWMGALIVDAGGDELSAYGVSLGDKGVAFEDVPSESLAGRLGFRKGDLIRSVNQRKIESVSDLRKYLLESGKKAAHSFELIRNQATIRINLTTTLDPMN
jgi:hypothetical protein